MEHSRPSQTGLDGAIMPTSPELEMARASTDAETKRTRRTELQEHVSRELPSTGGANFYFFQRNLFKLRHERFDIVDQ